VQGSRAPRLAVVGPRASGWILRVAGLSEASVRAQAACEQALGRRGLAAEIESAWAQLVASAAAAPGVQPAPPPPGVVRLPDSSEAVLTGRGVSLLLPRRGGDRG
jgi:hypothetical protein